MIDAIPLPIVSDIDGSARNESGENAGIIKASSVRGTMLDLEAESESVETAVVTFKFSNPLTLALEIEVLRVKLSAAETAITEAMKMTREAWRGEDIVVQVAKAAGETTPTKL